MELLTGAQSVSKSWATTPSPNPSPMQMSTQAKRIADIGDLVGPELDPELYHSAFFLGPRAENAEQWHKLITYIFNDYVHWRRNYFPTDPITITHERRRKHAPADDKLSSYLDYLLNELKAHFPFYSPRYVAHQISEQLLPSVLGYFAGMLYNPNNVTDEAAPVTVRIELEAGRLIAAMLGLDARRAWAHITSGGTLANFEALWVARTVQFAPLALRDLCKRSRYQFEIKLPDGQSVRLAEVSYHQLLSLKPNESIFMTRKLAKYLVDNRDISPNKAAEIIQSFMLLSKWNIASRGIAAVLKSLRLKPRILVSTAAHYSIAKAANVLGYGTDAVQFLSVGPRFRLDIDQLKEGLTSLKSNEYIAAVIAIVGTTEEGAVDPVDQIHFFRQELQSDYQRSFWLHVDAAWGGYIASLFRGHESDRLPPGSGLGAVCQHYFDLIKPRVRVTKSITAATGKLVTRSKDVSWRDAAVYSAYLALPEADSITIDPHKLGYVPYPAGVIVFKNCVVTDLLAQRAQYISEITEKSPLPLGNPPTINAVGPYIIEGSKPGAAAAAVWMAHKVVPLEHFAHGRMMLDTVMSAQRLHTYLGWHRTLFNEIDVQTGGKPTPSCQFTYESLFNPDTNIVCFVAVPMAQTTKGFNRIDKSIQYLNCLNRGIYERMSIRPRIDGDHNPSPMPYGQAFFVSRTIFEATQYDAKSISEVLDRIGINGTEYQSDGLFVMRATVMNPHYELAKSNGKDYLWEFVLELHKITRQIICELD